MNVIGDESSHLLPMAESIIELAFAEDIGHGDITTIATVPSSTAATATLLAKSPGVVSGMTVAEAVFAYVDPSITFSPAVQDGERVEDRTTLATLAGPARSLLTAERVALNFLQRLSGIATRTSEFVELVAETNARIVDTRKTTPGMRVFEKAAVVDGGGHNHRFGLSDGVLIKDNHLAAIDEPNRIEVAIRNARKLAPHTLAIEIEVTSLEEFRQALGAGADIIMLDNMSIDDMTTAVHEANSTVVLEASGGIDLSTVAAVAATGVDLISVGGLTHSSPSMDISLDFRIVGE